MIIMVQTSLVLQLLTHQQGNKGNQCRQGETVATGGFLPAQMAVTFISQVFPAWRLAVCCGDIMLLRFLFVVFLSPCRLTKQSAATLCNFTDDAFHNLSSDVTWRTRTDRIRGLKPTSGTINSAATGRSCWNLQMQNAVRMCFYSCHRLVRCCNALQGRQPCVASPADASRGLEHELRCPPASWDSSPEETLYTAVNTRRPKVVCLTSASASLLCCLETRRYTHTQTHAHANPIHKMYTLGNIKMLLNPLSLRFFLLPHKHNIWLYTRD